MKFELFVREVMLRLGFLCGTWSACLYRHPQSGLLVYVYGDNFVSKGPRAENLKLFEALQQHMWFKMEGILGPKGRRRRSGSAVPERNLPVHLCWIRAMH